MECPNCGKTMFTSANGYLCAECYTEIDTSLCPDCGSKLELGHSGEAYCEECGWEESGPISDDEFVELMRAS